MSYQSYGIPTLGTRFSFTRKYSTVDIPDLSGKTVVITGGTSGLGLESAIQMAKKGANVYILGSSETRGKQAVQTIHEKTGRTVVWHHCDLSQVKMAHESGRKLREMVSSIDVLLLNAGVGSGSTLPTADGYEVIFGINHLGHFAFVQQLMDTFTGEDVRVVVLSSMGHYSVKGIDYENLKPVIPKGTKKGPGPSSATVAFYSRSKLANILFARALQRRVGANVHVNAVHPGAIATNIQANLKEDLSDYGMFAGLVASMITFFFNYVGMSIADGALTQVYCCTSPEIAQKGYKGEYFVPIGVRDKTSKAAEDVDAQEKLWTWSEAAVTECL